MVEEIIFETPISMADVKQEIKKIKKRDEELNFRAVKVEEYLDTFTQLKKKDADELKKALEKLEIPRFKDVHIIKIGDMLPANVDDLKMLLQGYTITVNKENLEKIVSTVKKYLPAKK